MRDTEAHDHVWMGIQQIEEFIREGDLSAAECVFELTASGLAVHADQTQMARLLKLAVALKYGEDFFGGQPVSEVETAEPSRFGPH